MAVALKETALARSVVKTLEEEGWEVYKEVQCPRLKRVCDIYAVKRDKRGDISRSLVVECKNSFGLAVLEQASYWRRYSDEVAVAVPRPKARRARAFHLELLGLLGLGMLHATKSGRGYSAAKWCKPPAFHGMPNKRPELVEDHKKGIAGSPAGMSTTAYSRTMDDLLRVVTANPGNTLAYIVPLISHHYRSDPYAEKTLGQRLIYGIAGIVFRNGKLYPTKKK